MSNLLTAEYSSVLKKIDSIDLSLVQSFGSHFESIGYQNIGDECNCSNAVLTVVVPTYNRAELLIDTLRSVFSQAEKCVVLIIDNSDIELAREKLEVMRKEFPHNEFMYIVNDSNVGMYQNWNRGLSLVRTKWATLLHDDDMLLPEALRKFFNEASDNVDIVSGLSIVGSEFEVSRISLKQRFKHFFRPKFRLSYERMLRCNITPAPGIFIRTSLLSKAGPIDPQFYPVSDYIFYSRCFIHSRSTAMVNEPISFYRTSVSETFKGDTLERMAFYSMRFRLLLSHFSGESLLKQVILIDVYKKWAERLVGHSGDEIAKNFSDYYRPYLKPTSIITRVRLTLTRIFSMGAY